MFQFLNVQFEFVWECSKCIGVVLIFVLRFTGFGLLFCVFN